MTIFIAFLGYLAGFCAVISFIPQAIKTIKTKNTKAISLKTYITAQSFFLLFGILSIAIPIMHPENTSMIQIIVWGFTLILPYSATIMSVSCIIFIKVQNMKKFGESANKIDILKIENNSNELRGKNVI